MPEQKKSDHRRGSLVVFFTFLLSFYMMTYSGRIVSTDTLFLLDAVDSLVQFGDTRLDTSAGVRPPSPMAIVNGSADPLPDVNTEPLQIVLAAPLYQLARMLPHIGASHVVHLFNILTSAALGVLFYSYARVLGYSVRGSLLGAGLLATGTIIWPYSKAFFQEILATLLLLLAGLLLELWQHSGYRRVGWALLGMCAALGAVFSKQLALLGLPALVLIVLPALTGTGTRRDTVRRFALLLGGIVVLGVAAWLVLSLLGRVQYITRLLELFARPTPYTSVALHSYLLSIGGSIWGTSPVLLLAVPGMWLLHRQRQYRYVLVAIGAALSFAVITAYWQDVHWFGGLSWPPRFLIPAVPFVLLAALPVIDRAANAGYGRGWRVLVVVIAAYAVWVQLSAVTVPWEAFNSALPPEANGLNEWGGSLNLVRYLRWVVIPGLWGSVPLDFIWVRLNLPGWPLIFGGLVVLCGGILWRYVRGLYVAWWIVVGLPLVTGLCIVAGVYAAYADPAYDGENAALHEMLTVINAQAGPDDVVLLSNLTYERFFTNYHVMGGARVVSLPYHPGEQPSPQQSPEIVSDNPDILLHPASAALIYALAAERDQLYVLSDSGPFMPWRVRPVERFMAQHYYPVSVVETAPDARLIQYHTVPAPDVFAPLGPASHTDLRYGDALALLGYTLPLGDAYRPGDMLPVSLYWQADAAIAEDYQVAWFLRDSAGGEVAQGWDVGPQAGFAPTSTWQVNQPVWDNRALVIPEDTPAGRYRLWVVVYAALPDGTIHNLPVTGAEIVDNFIGVLPVEISIEG